MRSMADYLKIFGVGMQDAIEAKQRRRPLERPELDSDVKWEQTAPKRRFLQHDR
jgi:hypothetical protein